MPSLTLRRVLIVGSLGLMTSVFGYGMGALGSRDAAVVDTSLPAPPDSRDDKLGELQRAVSRLQRTIAALGAKNPSTELALLQQQLAALEARLDGMGRDTHAADSNPEVQLSEDEQRAIERAKTDVISASLEDHFQAEPRNETWAATIERSIGSTLKTEAGVEPRSIECQTSICKVEIDHMEQTAEDLFMHKLVHVRELGDTEAFLDRHEHADGTVSTLAYLAGDGKHLPPSPKL